MVIFWPWPNCGRRGREGGGTWVWIYDPILVRLLKMQPYSSQSSRENATPSSGTSLLAPYKEVPSPLLAFGVVQSFLIVS